MKSGFLFGRLAGLPFTVILLLITMLVVGLAGCGVGSSSTKSAVPAPTPTPSPTPTPMPTPTPPGSASTTPKFVYALNGTADVNSGVAEFLIDPASGVLSMRGTASVPVMHTDEGGMAATPQTEFVFVAQWLTKTIVVLRADPNSGMLAQSQVISVPELQSPPALITNPSGKFLYVADPNGFQILAFSIQPSGDLLPVPGSPFKVSNPPIGLTMDATGKFLFTGADHQVFGFTVAGNGALTPTPGSPVTVRPPFISPGKGPTWVSALLDPRARFLFVPDSTNPVMFVYTVAADGALTPVAGSLFPTATAGRTAAVAPSGKFVSFPTPSLQPCRSTRAAVRSPPSRARRLTTDHSAMEARRCAISAPTPQGNSCCLPIARTH